MLVRQSEDEFGEELRIYPFLNEGATDRQIGMAAHILAFVNPKMLDLFGIVRVNIAMDQITPEYWEQVNAAVQTAFSRVDEARKTIMPDHSTSWCIEGWDVQRQTVTIRLSSGNRLRMCEATPEFMEQLQTDETEWIARGLKTRDPFRTRDIERLPRFARLAAQAQSLTHSKEVSALLSANTMAQALETEQEQQ